MDYLIAIYTGKKIYTLILNPGITATIGDTLNDTVLIEKFNIGASYLTLECDAGGVRILAKSTMKIGNDTASDRVFSAGDIVSINERITLAVFESKCRTNNLLDLQDFEELRIGRSYNNNDVCLQYPDVSSVHALIKKENGHWTINDLGSRNGTFVNSQLIDP